MKKRNLLLGLAIILAGCGGGGQTDKTLEVNIDDSNDEIHYLIFKDNNIEVAKMVVLPTDTYDDLEPYFPTIPFEDGKPVSYWEKDIVVYQRKNKNVVINAIRESDSFVGLPVKVTLTHEENTIIGDDVVYEDKYSYGYKGKIDIPISFEFAQKDKFAWVIPTYYSFDKWECYMNGEMVREYTSKSISFRLYDGEFQGLSSALELTFVLRAK